LICVIGIPVEILVMLCYHTAVSLDNHYCRTSTYEIKDKVGRQISSEHLTLQTGTLFCARAEFPAPGGHQTTGQIGTNFCEATSILNSSYIFIVTTYARTKVSVICTLV
jgi:hypothetical protein